MDAEYAIVKGRERFAQLTSTIGAGVLGVGIGALLGPHISGYALLILLLGVVMHSWGMLDMRRMEKAGQMPARPVWSLILYWICWLALLVLIGLISWQVSVQEEITMKNRYPIRNVPDSGSPGPLNSTVNSSSPSPGVA